VAYVLQGIFIFEIFPTLLLLFLLAGFLQFSLQEIELKPALLPGKSRVNRLIPLTALLAPVIFYLAWQYTLLPARAMAKGFEAAKAFGTDQKSFERKWQEAIAVRQPYRQDLWLELSSFILEDDSTKPRFSLKPSELERILEVTLESFSEIERDSRLEARFFFQAGRIGNFLRSIGGNVSDQEIEKNLQKAKNLSPRRVDIYFELAEFERSRQNTKKMFEYLEEALRLDPQIPQSHFNLAIAYAGEGKLERAYQEVSQAQELGYIGWQRNYNEVSFLIALYLKLGLRNEKLLEFYQYAIVLQPSDPQLYASAAALLKELGKFEEAAIYAKKVAELDPNRSGEVEAFLRSIGRN
jgi:tetratricopeptide (TPR) repeat protein